MPPESEGEKLRSIMLAPVDDTSRLSDSSGSYPKFHPHITLASFPSQLKIPLSQIRAALSKFLTPVPVEFQSLATGPHFFRSAFLVVNRNSALSLLHDEIHTRLGIKVKTPNFPHLSLAYIEDVDALKGEREKYIECLVNAGRIRYEGRDRVSLNCTGQFTNDGGDWISGFLADDVWIVDCDGLVENWKVLDRHSFRGSKAF